jgi:hypothetical protein
MFSIMDIYMETKDTKELNEFPDDFILITDSAVIREMFPGERGEIITGVMCKVSEGDYSSLWICYEPAPYHVRAIYEQVI